MVSGDRRTRSPHQPIGHPQSQKQGGQGGERRRADLMEIHMVELQGDQNREDIAKNLLKDVVLQRVEGPKHFGVAMSGCMIGSISREEVRPAPACGRRR
jgi:hypothetical protein